MSDDDRPSHRSNQTTPALLFSGAFVPLLAMAALWIVRIGAHSLANSLAGKKLSVAFREERGVKAMDRDEACAAVVFQLAYDPHLRPNASSPLIEQAELGAECWA